MQLSWKVGRSFHSFEYVQGSAENFPDCDENKVNYLLRRFSLKMMVSCNYL